jgi:hypothetical protein
MSNPKISPIWLRIALVETKTLIQQKLKPETNNDKTNNKKKDMSKILYEKQKLDDIFLRQFLIMFNRVGVLITCYNLRKVIL